METRDGLVNVYPRHFLAFLLGNGLRSGVGLRFSHGWRYFGLTSITPLFIVDA